MFSLTDFKVLILTQERKGVRGGGWGVGERMESTEGGSHTNLVPRGSREYLGTRL